MNLIPNWKEVLVKSLVNWAAYIGTISGVLDLVQGPLTTLLPQLKPLLPEGGYTAVMLTCLVLIPALRVINQGLSIFAAKEAP